jgi:hypothetical protein
VLDHLWNTKDERLLNQAPRRIIERPNTITSVRKN